MQGNPSVALGAHYAQMNYRLGDVLGQGYLTKIGQRWKSHKRRWFVITFQDIKYYENRVRSSLESWNQVAHLAGLLQFQSPLVTFKPAHERSLYVRGFIISTNLTLYF
jgi:hypothetical protein